MCNSDHLQPSLAPLSPEEVESILAGLRAIHAQGVLHRDIRLENVLASCDLSGPSCASLASSGSTKRKFLWVDFGHSCVSSTFSDQDRIDIEEEEEAECQSMLQALRYAARSLR